jgi:hypothetical protein
VPWPPRSPDSERVCHSFFLDVTHTLKMEATNSNVYSSRCLTSLQGVICMCMLFDIEAPSFNGMILNAALALLFYVCGHEFLFENSSIGNPQYAPEIWHQTPGTSYIGSTPGVQ